MCLGFKKMKANFQFLRVQVAIKIRIKNKLKTNR